MKINKKNEAGELNFRAPVGDLAGKVLTQIQQSKIKVIFLLVSLKSH
jgi:hypothetical protein